MLRLLQFVTAVAFTIAALAELGWITINHPWLAQAHTALLRIILTILHLLS